MNLTDWKKHITAEIADTGRWIGLADENGFPLADLPPAVTTKIPEVSFGPSTCEITIPTAPADPLLDFLADGELGLQTATGALAADPAPARFVVVQTTTRRHPYQVTHITLSGGVVPETMTIHAVGDAEFLAGWPAPADPAGWEKAHFDNWVTDASGARYAHSRRLARVPLVTNVEDSHRRGTARDALRRFVQSSFDAVNKTLGFTDPHAVVVFDGDKDPTPEVWFRAGDDFLWDTIAEVVKNIGLTVAVDLWWPGDPPVLTSVAGSAPTPTTWPQPILTVHIDLKEAL